MSTNQLRISRIETELSNLLRLLSGDLSYDNINTVKIKLKDLLNNHSIMNMWFAPLGPGSLFEKRCDSETESINGCLCEGGRGDCEHFVGLPKIENETTTNAWGRPHGWCEVCWRGEQIKRLKRSLHMSSANYGGELYADNCVKESLGRPVKEQ